MKALVLSLTSLLLSSLALAQDIDKMKYSIDSLAKEKELLSFKLKTCDRKIDSLKIAMAETIEKGISETTSKINQLVGSGIKVEVKEAVHLSSSLSLNSSGILIPAKKTVTLNRRMDNRCYVLITHNNTYRGYIPIYYLALPSEIESLEQKLKKFIGADYFPIATPESTNSTSPAIKAQPYSSSYNTSSKTKDCESVQCSGRTKKGDRCRNVTTNCNGRCHLH